MDIDNDPRFDLVQEGMFAISAEEWSFGSAAISNYMPGVLIFRIVTTDSPNEFARFGDEAAETSQLP